MYNIILNQPNHKKIKPYDDTVSSLIRNDFKDVTTKIYELSYKI